MTGKEIVNLIDELRKDGVSDTRIIDLIRYIELTDPKEKEAERREREKK